MLRARIRREFAEKQEQRHGDALHWGRREEPTVPDAGEGWGAHPFLGDRRVLLGVNFGA